jgi:hypothetical protein
MNILKIKKVINGYELLVPSEEGGEEYVYSFDESGIDEKGEYNSLKSVLYQIIEFYQPNSKHHKYNFEINLRENTIFDFEEIWALYPKRIGRKQAEKYFNASVKTQQDFEDIKQAIANYQKTKEFKEGFIKHGSTFFNNWRDYVQYEENPKSRDSWR